MNKSLDNLSIKDQIDWLSRFIIIHSILYYECDTSIISDRIYDEYSKYLAQLIKDNPNELNNCYYKYVIYDFDGTTGFDLRSRLTKKDNEYLTHLARYILRLQGCGFNEQLNNKKGDKNGIRRKKKL